jgi:hypothetical protein
MFEFFSEETQGSSNNLALVCIFEYHTSKCGHFKALTHNAYKLIKTSMLPIS